jgi:transcriptional regulator with PAS, ATPase and Fis domain
MITKVAGTDSTVLITGKSGTGKELAARMIHELSPRKEQPFIAVNCAALTETLLESELFGHEKGAFTGAVARKRGRFELADGGTIFLDEIGETSPSMQSKLLRVLEERKLVRVGGVDLIDIDVRVIAATNRNLKEQVKNGNFREDLFFRINVFPIEMPNLSERKEDIIELSKSFLKDYPHPDLSQEVTDLLLAYDWPGNIRELRNVLERAMILAGGEPLTAEDFNLDVDDTPLVSNQSPGLSEGGLEQTEKKMILEALEKAGGNKTEAAKLLKISRRRLYSRMKVHGIKFN